MTIGVIHEDKIFVINRTGDSCETCAFGDEQTCFRVIQVPNNRACGNVNEGYVNYQLYKGNEDGNS